MFHRGDRRDRTLNYAIRARRVWLSFGYPDRPVGEFFKHKAIGCRCRRCPKGQPKLPASLCHLNAANGGYHPTVQERIQGKRLAHAWLQALRSGISGDDVEL